MTPILLIGASGFVGRRLTQKLRAQGRAVRCLVRDPARVGYLASTGSEIVHGDIADPAAVQRAVASVAAVYISVHTLSPQPGGAAGARFMEIERQGVENVVAACRAQRVRRVIYLTSLGIAPDDASEWLRERWRAEQSLLDSGLDATVIRPGMIVGVGGRGFDTMVANARRRVALTLGADRPRMRTIGLDDLVDYLTGVIDEPRAYGQRFDVGNDDVLSANQLIDTLAELLNRRPPIKIQIPTALLGALAPLIERLGKLAPGAMTGFVASLGVDAIGDPAPIRAILPQPLLSFREAAAQALRL